MKTKEKEFICELSEVTGFYATADHDLSAWVYIEFNGHSTIDCYGYISIENGKVYGIEKDQ